MWRGGGRRFLWRGGLGCGGVGCFGMVEVGRTDRGGVGWLWWEVDWWLIGVLEEGGLFL